MSEGQHDDAYNTEQDGDGSKSDESCPWVICPPDVGLAKHDCSTKVTCVRWVYFFWHNAGDDWYLVTTKISVNKKACPKNMSYYIMAENKSI